MKLKPVERYEIEHIAKADTFIMSDLERPSNQNVELYGGLIEAKMILENQKTDKSCRKLIYAYNKKAEESGALSRFICLTLKNIELYEAWLAEQKVVA